MKRNNKLTLISALILIPLSVYVFYTTSDYYNVTFLDTQDYMFNMRTNGSAAHPDGSGKRAMIFTDVIYTGHVTFISNTCENIFSILPDDDLNYYTGQYPIIHIRTACENHQTVIGGRDLDAAIKLDIQHTNTTQYKFSFDGGKASLYIDDQLVHADNNSYHYRAAVDTIGYVQILDSRK